MTRTRAIVAAAALAAAGGIGLVNARLHTPTIAPMNSVCLRVGQPPIPCPGQTPPSIHGQGHP